MTDSSVVLDANLALAAIDPSERHCAQALDLLTSLAKSNVRLIAPALFESEVDSAIRRRVYLGKITPETGALLFQALDALAVEIVHDARVRLLAREIAAQCNQVRCYDATYAALAQLLGLEMWTADENFYSQSAARFPHVRFIGEVNSGGSTAGR